MLETWVVQQLRGENPSDLRQIYEATHYPIAAVYRFLAPVTRETLQGIVLKLMRAVAGGSREVPPHELFALVDPVFSSSVMRDDALDLLLSLTSQFPRHPDLRHPTLLAIRRIGHRGTAVWWISQLKGEDDEALVLLLEGLADASLTEWFATLSDFRWTAYVADCVASLTPWLIDTFGNEAVVPRLLRLLADRPAEVRRPILAMIGVEDLPLPRTDHAWREAIEAFVTGESQQQPWNMLDIAPARWSTATERTRFKDALQNWLSTWKLETAKIEDGRRLTCLLSAYPSDTAVAAMIGALHSLPVANRGAESFFKDALEVIAASPQSVRELWRKDANARTNYGRWLAHALAVPSLRDLAIIETVKWIDSPDASPYLEMIWAGGISVKELRDISRAAGMNERTILQLLVEIYKSAMNAEDEKIMKEIQAIVPDFAQQVLRVEEERSGGIFTQAMTGRRTAGADA